MRARVGRARIALAALALSTFAYVTAETLPIGLLPEIAHGLRSSTSAVGLLVTAYGLVVVVATIPLTRLTHRWSRRRLLGILLTVFSVATTLSALAPNYSTLLGARIAIALSQAVFWAVVAPAAAALFSPAMRGRAVSILFAGTSLGPLVGVPAGTWLGQLTGWRVPFLVLGGIGLAILAMLHAVLPEVPAGRSDTDRGSAPDAGRYRVLVVATALTVTGAFTAFTYINPFLTEVSGFAESAVGPILLVRGLAGLIGVVAVGFVVARHGWSVMTLLIGLQGVALTAQFVFGAQQAATVVATAVSSLALAATSAALGARVLQVAPGDTDLAGAGTSTAFNVGITSGALIGSLLVTGPGVRSSALAGAALSMVAFAVMASEPLLASRRRGDVGKIGKPAPQRPAATHVS
jgi:DHA1 family inner membrane transport protein